MKFGAHLADVDPRLPIEIGDYRLMVVTMATRKTLSSGLLPYHCRNNGPFWKKMGVYLAKVDPSFQSQTGRYSLTDVTMTSK